MQLRDRLPSVGVIVPLLLALGAVAWAESEPVTAVNLLASERFWPYRVALTERLPVPGRAEPLAAGTTGVLIRVEPSGLPRVDFGGAGKYELPLATTDLLERANRIRRGELAKEEPNFVHAIKARMLDSASETLRTLPMDVASARQRFLCVFADPDGEGFAALAGALAPLREREDLMTIFLPQGQHGDASVRDRLRALGWTVPFLPDFLSEPYTRTLLAEMAPMPYVLLHTSEGRVIFQGPWSVESFEALRAALDAASAPTAAAYAPSSAASR